MKKRVLFLMHHMWHGGTEKALLSLLQTIDYGKYDVSLMILLFDSADVSNVPSEVHISEIPIPNSEKGILCGNKKQQILTLVKSGDFFKAGTQLIYNYKYAIKEDRSTHAKYYNKSYDRIPIVNEQYDFAIDYFGYQTFTTFFLAEKIKAKVKITWLHGIMLDSNMAPYQVYYKKIDRIIAVSEGVKESFNKCFPNMGKCRVIHNVIHSEQIINLANEWCGFYDDFNGTRIVTVGRVSPEKGIDLAIKAYVKLRRENYNIRWYWVGAKDDNLILNFAYIYDDELQKENFVFTDNQSNPYGYMKNCDIYVQPSYTEGYCIATNEAKILGCCVIRTDTPDAKEQFTHGETGSIVPIDENALYQEIKKLIEHPEIRERYKRNLLEVVTTKKEENCDIFELLGEN